MISTANAPILSNVLLAELATSGSVANRCRSLRAVGIETSALRVGAILSPCAGLTRREPRALAPDLSSEHRPVRATP